MTDHPVFVQQQIAAIKVPLISAIGLPVPGESQVRFILLLTRSFRYFYNFFFLLISRLVNRHPFLLNYQQEIK